MLEKSESVSSSNAITRVLCKQSMPLEGAATQRCYAGSPLSLRVLAQLFIVFGTSLCITTNSVFWMQTLLHSKFRRRQVSRRSSIRVVTQHCLQFDFYLNLKFRRYVVNIHDETLTCYVPDKEKFIHLFNARLKANKIIKLWSRLSTVRGQPQYHTQRKKQKKTHM